MNMQNYKRFIPYVLIALVLTAMFLLLNSFRPRERKMTFSRNFKETIKEDQSFEIAGFTEGESWNGNYTFDNARSFDGEVGMNIFSTPNSPVTITRIRPMDLSAYDAIYAFIYMPQEDTVSQIQELQIGFENEDGIRTTANLAPKQKGWNLVKTTKKAFSQKDFNWSQVTKTTVRLLSKNGFTVQIALDRIWAQNKMDSSGFITGYTPEFVNLKKVNKDTYLHLAAPIAKSLGFDKEVGNDFTYTVLLAPMKAGSFTLLFQTDKENNNGYRFSLDGSRMAQWKLAIRNNNAEKTIAEGLLKNSVLENEAYTWLRVEKKGSAITASYSLDGSRYQPIVDQVRDNTLRKGFIGIAYKGAYLIDSVSVEE